MSKGRDSRGPRRRGFDDDMFSPLEIQRLRSPRPSEVSVRDTGPAEGSTSEATVQWFNANKGFGFAEMADGSGDVFLHVAVLKAAGHTTAAAGAKLQVNVGQGPKGRQITRVTHVDETNAAEAPNRRPGPSNSTGSRERLDSSTAVEMSGTVKWFNGEKGFGFIASADQGKDVFIHISALNQAGLSILAEGQRISMRVVETSKGREAISIAIAE